jgi:hypothetical protein
MAMKQERLREFYTRLEAMPAGPLERWAEHAVVVRGPLSVNTRGSVRGTQGHPGSGEQLFEVDSSAFPEVDSSAAPEAEAKALADAVAEFCAHAPRDMAELLAALGESTEAPARANAAALLLTSCLEHLWGQHGQATPERSAYVLTALEAARGILVGAASLEPLSWIKLPGAAYLQLQYQPLAIGFVPVRVRVCTSAEFQSEPTTQAVTKALADSGFRLQAPLLWVEEGAWKVAVLNLAP